MNRISETKVKKFIFNNWVLKIISVILAAILWLLVINIDDPQVTANINNIPVTILNDSQILDNDEMYYVVSGGTVDIKITGPRTIVDSLKRGDFTATADFMDLSKTNAVPIDVVINNSDYENKVSIVSKSENAMRLSIEEVLEKEYDISVQYSTSVMEGYIVYETVPDVDRVTVRAPKSVHNTIAKAEAVLSFAGTETSDFSYSATVRLRDNNGSIINIVENNITLSDPYIKVDGTIYYKKTVDIKYTIVDNLSEQRVLAEYDGNPKQIDIVGKKTVLDEITEIEIPQEYTTITDENMDIEVDLQTILPKGVFVYGSDGMFKITTSVKNIITKTISIRASDIGIRKIPDGYEGSVTGENIISLVVSGIEEDVKGLNADNIAPFVDMTGAKTGNNSVVVQAVLPDGVSLVTNINVTVTITRRDGDSTTEPTTTESTTAPTITEGTTESDEQNTTITDNEE